MNYYKIGKFAQNLGVTPDLLKHYEENQLIKSIREEQNQYRYYSFSQAKRIYHAKELQKIGLTIKEIQDVFNNYHEATLLALIEKKENEWAKESIYRQIIMDEIKQFHHILKQINLNQFEHNWTIEQIPDLYFFHHSNENTFSNASLHHAILKEWIDHLMIIKQATHIELEPLKYHYGFIIEADKAKKLQLQIDDSLISYIPNHKALLYCIKVKPNGTSGKAYIQKVLQEPIILLNRLNLKYRRILGVNVHTCYESYSQHVNDSTNYIQLIIEIV